VIELSLAVATADPKSSVTIATTNYGLTPEWLDRVRSRLPNVDIHIFPHVGEHTTLFSMPMIRWLWSEIKRYDVAHIHALLQPNSSTAAWVARHRKCPYIIRPLGTLSPYTFAHRRTALKHLYYGLVDARTIAGARYIHFTTELEFKKAKRLGFTTPEVIVPIPHSESLKTEGESKPRDILFLSRLDPKKGIEKLLTAFATMQRGSTKLVIAGSGDRQYEQQLHKMTDRLGIGSTVRFTGFVEGQQKSELFSEAQLLVLPSREENFGVVLLEAMGLGIPVVITKGVDIWPEVAKYNAGIVVEDGIDSLAQGMAQIAGDSVLRAQLSGNAKQLVSTMYSPKQVGKQLLQVYADAARR
jgi:glycosyltransferase involved in cell wall biosynthesis